MLLPVVIDLEQYHGSGNGTPQLAALGLDATLEVHLDLVIAPAIGEWDDDVLILVAMLLHHLLQHR